MIGEKDTWENSMHEYSSIDDNLSYVISAADVMAFNKPLSFKMV